jgi:hypothetical protein
LINFNRQGLLYSTIFLLGGCLNTPHVASEANSPAQVASTQNCEIPADAFNQLPIDVLDGTDVIAIKEFKPASISGAYFQTEIGGANITINLQTLNDHYKTLRKYSEPDIENTTTAFDQLCIDESYLYGERVRGIFTEKGILWLELNSDIEFISSDLWIYLEKTN